MADKCGFKDDPPTRSQGPPRKGDFTASYGMIEKNSIAIIKAIY